MVVPGRWQAQDGVDDRPIAERVADPLPLLLTSTDDRIPRPDACLHLDRDDRPERFESDVRR
jgi:hypothetical protein